MKHPLKLSLLIALALGSTQLMAVDFGQVQVKSSLGQPLVAEIPLRGATAAELKGLTAEQASNAEYTRAGITSGRARVPLEFSVVTGAGGSHLIRVTSVAAIDDPYVDLLLDVNTPAGRSVHEFAILLDPPGMAMAPSAAPAAPGVAAAAAAPAAPARAAPATVAPATAKPAAGVSGDKYGPVKAGQTLSGIAQQTLPAGVDLAQMLVALKQANPEAFYRDNISALKSGAVLRVPTASEAQAVTVAAAIAEVRRQNGEWRGVPASAPATVANAATRAPAASGAARGTAAAGDRLALLAAKDDAKGGTASGGGNAGASAAELRRSLLQTQESLASAQQQTADLRSRLKDMTDINNKSTRLLALKDSEIAELQAKLAAARKGGAVPAAAAAAPAAMPAAAAPAAATTARSAVASVPAGAASATPAATASTAVAAATKTPAAAKPAATRPVPTPAPQPWYMQGWAWIAGVGVVVLLILFGLLKRQRKQPAAPRPRTAPSLADSFGGPKAGGDGTADPDQDELLDQLAEHPDDIALNLQLVTLYYSRRDVEHFEAAAEAMHAHIQDPDQDEWQDVVHMGEDLVPEHPLFSHAPTAEVPDAPVEEFNIDDYGDEATATKATAAALEGVSIPDGGAGADELLHAAAYDAAAAELHTVSADRLVDAHDGADEIPAAAAVEAVPVGADGDDQPAPAAGSHEAAGIGQGEAADALDDNPIDVKLDLARAYLDMGDDEGARAMLDEVMKEGSQMQKDVATGLLAGLKH